MTATQLKSLFPPLTSFSDADVTAKIALAAPHFNVSRWGDFYAEGLANWVCHWLVVDDLPLAADDGAEISEGVGDTSFSLNAQVVFEQAHDAMLRTRYGQRYRELADMVGMGGATA